MSYSKRSRPSCDNFASFYWDHKMNMTRSCWLWIRRREGFYLKRSTTGRNCVRQPTACTPRKSEGPQRCRETATKRTVRENGLPELLSVALVMTRPVVKETLPDEKQRTGSGGLTWLPACLPASWQRVGYPTTSGPALCVAR
ncbi:hypothetical protein PM082_003437 [Marasmius tenuissimus]|nr:hypothetical protein PM082_003437 [Marasmius tenuissimus]